VKPEHPTEPPMTLEGSDGFGAGSVTSILEGLRGSRIASHGQQLPADQVVSRRQRLLAEPPPHYVIMVWRIFCPKRRVGYWVLSISQVEYTQGVLSDVFRCKGGELQ
jgi:hypothetical protein